MPIPTAFEVAHDRAALSMVQGEQTGNAAMRRAAEIELDDLATRNPNAYLDLLSQRLGSVQLTPLIEN